MIWSPNTTGYDPNTQQTNLYIIYWIEPAIKTILSWSTASCADQKCKIKRSNILHFHQWPFPQNRSSLVGILNIIAKYFTNSWIDVKYKVNVLSSWSNAVQILWILQRLQSYSTDLISMILIYYRAKNSLISHAQCMDASSSSLSFHHEIHKQSKWKSVQLFVNKIQEFMAVVFINIMLLLFERYHTECRKHIRHDLKWMYERNVCYYIFFMHHRYIIHGYCIWCFFYFLFFFLSPSQKLR